MLHRCLQLHEATRIADRLDPPRIPTLGWTDTTLFGCTLGPPRNPHGIFVYLLQTTAALVICLIPVGRRSRSWRPPVQRITYTSSTRDVLPGQGTASPSLKTCYTMKHGRVSCFLLFVAPPRVS